MPDPLVILDTLPSPTDFYGLYWNQKPFVVKGAVAKSAMADLISADELAGLAMEDAPQSRMVKTAGQHQDWSCHFGPFSEQDFKAAGDTDWALLVQNVEQFHPPTAKLLRHFGFAPRWLMDDIMVSYSATGGSVGPHLDSYHVFLVQGQGRRRWKVTRQAVRDEIYIDGLDLKVLAGGITGDEIEMACGDVLYVPPRFGHEGTTVDEALTFSVGFLGPKMSDLFTSYGQYLSEHEDLDDRYVGDGLKTDSAGFEIAGGAVQNLQDGLSGHLKTDEFTRWLVAFFTEANHQDFGDYDERDAPLDLVAFADQLRQGASLVKPEYIKFALTSLPSGAFCLGFDNQSVTLEEPLLPLVRQLLNEQPLDIDSHPEILDQPASLEFLLGLYNHQVLELCPV